MQETGNYKLKKPAGTDIVNIEDLNANSDIIDRELANKAQKEHTHTNYVNQNTFSNVKVGNTTIAADNTTDTLTLTAGSNITLTPDATNDKITISATDTKYSHPYYAVRNATFSKITSDAMGHIADVTPVTKADITSLGIPELSDITPDAIGAFNTNCNKFDNSKDWNNYTKSGQYRVSGCYDASSKNGPPSGYYDGILLVFTSKNHNNENYACVTQLYLSQSQNYHTAYRIKNNIGNWTVWYEIKDTIYTHPTTSGYKHIPAGGSSGQILKWNGSGTASWQAEKDTTYTHPTYTSKANGLYKVTVDGTGHISSTSAVTKTDITNLGIAPTSSPIFSSSISMGRKAGTTVGSSSVALGNSVIASGNYSHAEGNETTASGYYSHAEGLTTKASNDSAHAEGYMTIASGSCSHAEGYNTTASGSKTHAEGYGTEASSDYSHAEGCMTTASGGFSHAEGNKATAEGICSHAEGASTLAKGINSHSGGESTIASSWSQTAIGRFNKDDGNADNILGNYFVIGNGTSNTSRSNCFRITADGRTYGLSAFQSSGADYAEYFEWLDGNMDNEDRVGYFVTMQGNKIKKAESSQDYVLGIVSAQPCIIGNSDEDWLGRWKHDEFGRFLRCQIESEEVVGEEYVPNPDYDPDQTYTERKDRKEWSAIGMMGVLAVRDDGTCKVNGFCTVKEGGIATATNNTNGYRVIERVTETIVKVVFR